MTEYEVEQHNYDHWYRTRVELETFEDAKDSERAWLDRMVERTRERLVALGQTALSPIVVLMGEQGQGEL